MFSFWDWLIIIIYLISAFTIGVLMTRKASGGLTSYFIADRSLPWWWLGTSMVATTFASDTPLAITGIVAKDGIAGNWFWWSSVITFITVTIFFARRWRSSRVLTDVELIELRYDGRSASLLRLFKAFYMGILVNCIVLGWVFRAISKITSPFVDWKILLGENIFNTLHVLWPGFLIFDNFNNTLTVLIIFMIVVAYSSMGGIRGVILTDLFQFALAMGTAIIFAVVAVQYVGGLNSLFSKLAELYPAKSNDILRFFPRFDNVLMPFDVFLIFIGVQWWAHYFSDGSGYLAQRMNTAKTPAEAEKGSLWFTLANYCLRTWPWILVALVALVAFPLNDPTKFHSLGQTVANDREMGYPALMKLLLPSGLLGLTFASLMAAFMSTVDTHINWGASYLVNDIYKRFIRPNATEKELVFASRSSVVFISFLAVLVASQIQSIEQAWKFFVAMGAGLGLPQILRWIWWRANAWTEITGMISAFTCSLVLYTVFPDTRSEYLIFWTVVISTTASLIGTFLTQPNKKETLQRFVKQTNSIGFWAEYSHEGKDHKILVKRMLMWMLGIITTLCGMFAIGYFLLLNSEPGAILLVVSIISFVILIKLMSASKDDEEIS